MIYTAGTTGNVCGVWLLFIVNLAGKIAAIYVGRTAPATTLALWFLPDALLGYHLFVPGAQGLVRVAFNRAINSNLCRFDRAPG